MRSFRSQQGVHPSCQAIARCLLSTAKALHCVIVLLLPGETVGISTLLCTFALQCVMTRRANLEEFKRLE